MVYVVETCEEPKHRYLVKAGNEDELIERVSFKGGVEILGRITDTEISTLDSSAFCVITV